MKKRKKSIIPAIIAIIAVIAVLGIAAASISRRIRHSPSRQKEGKQLKLQTTKLWRKAIHTSKKLNLQVPLNTWNFTIIHLARRKTIR